MFILRTLLVEELCHAKTFVYATLMWALHSLMEIIISSLLFVWIMWFLILHVNCAYFMSCHEARRTLVAKNIYFLFEHEFFMQYCIINGCGRKRVMDQFHENHRKKNFQWDEFACDCGKEAFFDQPTWIYFASIEIWSLNFEEQFNQNSFKLVNSWWTLYNSQNWSMFNLWFLNSVKAIKVDLIKKLQWKIIF
jgi:hypothetical protein